MPKKKQIKITLAYLHFISSAGYSVAVVAASSVSLFLCFIFPSFVPYSTARTLKQTYTARHSVFLRIQVCLAFKQKVLEQETLTFVVFCSLKQTGNIIFISELHATERIETTRIFHLTALWPQKTSKLPIGYMMGVAWPTSFSSRKHQLSWACFQLYY